MNEKEIKEIYKTVDKAKVELEAKNYIIRVLLEHINKDKVRMDLSSRWNSEWASMDGLVRYQIEEFVRKDLA